MARGRPVVTVGLTFDTGALIALERRSQRMRDVLRRSVERRLKVTVSTAVLAEWWRGAGRDRREILQSVDIEPLTEHLAKLAGEAIGDTPTATTVDAIVMASAAQRGDVVYTSDFDDLDRLHRYFKSVHRVLKV
jgi:predicted nucleic acid-binding protein